MRATIAEIGFALVVKSTQSSLASSSACVSTSKDLALRSSGTETASLMPTASSAAVIAAWLAGEVSFRNTYPTRRMLNSFT